MASQLVPDLLQDLLQLLTKSNHYNSNHSYFLEVNVMITITITSTLCLFVRSRMNISVLFVRNSHVMAKITDSKRLYSRDTFRGLHVVVRFLV